jgi:acyl-coenzyme A synthetase/AMP-(fatty) acid ligase
LILPEILAGASLDLQERMHVLTYLDRERRFQSTIVFATPTICAMLLKGFKTPRITYAVFVTSGQRISEALFLTFDTWVGGQWINQYGSTEMGATAACDPHEGRRRCWNTSR